MRVVSKEENCIGDDMPEIESYYTRRSFIRWEYAVWKFWLNILEPTAKTHFYEKWHFHPIEFIWFKFATIVDFGVFAGQSKLC